MRGTNVRTGARTAVLAGTIVFGLAVRHEALWSSAQIAAAAEPTTIREHLRDGEEFVRPLDAVLAIGKALFEANWTTEEGGGRPLTKGTGRPLSDPATRLAGTRAFNRISAPDSNSCAGCHNAPYGISGGGGDFVTNVFLLGQRFDFMTFDATDSLPTRGAVDETGQAAPLQGVSDLRATTGMFGSGYLELLAREMTAELQRTRNSVRVGETRALSAKGVSFGTLTLTRNGLWDTSNVEGLPRL